MNSGLLSPKEIAESWFGISRKKANLSVIKMVLLGVLAGIFIGFGAHAYLMVTQTLGGYDVGVAKLVGASVFPVGIMMVVIAGAELFTGNNLMMVSVFSKGITVNEMLKNWFFVFVGNLIGSVALGVLLANTGLYSGAILEKAIAVAEAKVSLTFSQALIRGVLCNILVVIAVWMQGACKDVISKLFALWFPVMLFVLSGFEHSIANLFFIPLGIMLGADVPVMTMIVQNILPVTIGNILGGGVFVSSMYYYLYLSGAKGIGEEKLMV